MAFTPSTDALIPIGQTVSKKYYKGRPIPIGRIKIIEVLTCPKLTEYLCTVGSANIVVSQSHGIGGSRWDADMITSEDEYTNTRIRFLGKGAHEES